MDFPNLQISEVAVSDREELRLLYATSVREIAMYTREQWLATTYALAMYAAMLFIAYQPSIEGSRPWQNWLPFLLTWAICISGLIAVKRLQLSIVAGRRRLERVRQYFGRPFNDAWMVPKSPEDVHRLLYVVVILGAVLVTLLISSRP